MSSTIAEPTSGDNAGEPQPSSSFAAQPHTRRRLLLLSIIAAGLLLVLAIRALVAEPYSISASSAQSMSPQLRAGERVLVAKFGAPLRGDLAVVSVGEGWPVAASEGTSPTLLEQTLRPAAQALGVDSSERSVLVRIVARGGDTVTCCSQRRIRVNGDPVGGQMPATAAPFKIAVPAGRLFVLSDNPEAANDSWVRMGPRPTAGDSDGTIAADAVVGTVIARVWPPGRLGGIPRPPTGEPR